MTTCGTGPSAGGGVAAAGGATIGAAGACWPIAAAGFAVVAGFFVVAGFLAVVVFFFGLTGVQTLTRLRLPWTLRTTTLHVFLTLAAVFFLVFFLTAPTILPRWSARRAHA